MARIELPAKYATIPHELLFDPALGDAEVRLYGILYRLGWERVEIEGAADLVARWPTPEGERAPSERSIYRWLAGLRAAGWITYEPRPGQRGIGDRLGLYATAQPPESPAEPSDTSVRASDTRIRASDTRIRASDTSVRGPLDLPHQDAAEHATQILREIPCEIPPPPTPSAPPGGGGGEGDDSETRTILRAAGVKSPQALTRLSGVPPAVARRTAAACRRMGGGRDPAALLVSYLDAYLASGEEIAPAPPARPPDPPPLPDAPLLPPARRAALVAAARAGWRQERLE